MPNCPDSPHPAVLAGIAAGLAFVGAAFTTTLDAAPSQACPPYCATPIITPAWHIHMCDESYEDQLDDNHCMVGPGITEFVGNADRVHIIYCHKYSDTVVVEVHDQGGGLQYVNHPDGMTYEGERCESMEFYRPGGIAAAGSPYRTSAYWPEGPFHGVSPGVEWYIGLFIAFDADAYYGNNAEAQITARDPAANTSPQVRDIITATVSSDSDPVGITIDLQEELAGFPVFKTVRPLRFSQLESDPVRGVIKVADRDTVRVRYCPRDCRTPYEDTAVWYQMTSTITPTPLPTWPGPPPTVTATPPPQLQVEYLTLRPWSEDVGYAPQITNKGRPNHLGYPNLFAGMWTRGTNAHRGMIQFDMSDVPEGASILEARLELVGQNSRLTRPGTWRASLLADSIDPIWRTATYDQVASAAIAAAVGSPLLDSDLAQDRVNSFGFSPAAVAALNTRLNSTNRASFRIDGPTDSDNLFAWETGVDVYGRATEPPDPADRPRLVLSYVAPRDGERGSATPTLAPGFGSSTPSATSTHLPTLPAGSASATASRTAVGSTATQPGGGTGATATPTQSGGGPGSTASATMPPPTITGTASPPVPTASYTAPSVPTPGGPTASATSQTNTPDPGATAAATSVGTVTMTPTTEGPATGRQLCVLAFVDRDLDGLRQLNEPFLPGVTVRLTHLPSGAFITWTTDGSNDPDHCWAGLADGPYTLAAVEMPRGFRATGLSERSFLVPFTVPSVQHEFGAEDTTAPTRTPPATPTPTSPPVPTQTGSSPTPTIRPSPSPQPTVSGPSGQICVAVYLDRDANGFRDTAEPYLADQRVRIEDAAGVTVRELDTLVDGPVCARLAVGVYHVKVEAAAGLVPTTAQDQPVLLTEGAETLVEFGRRRRGGTVYLPLASTISRFHVAVDAMVAGDVGAARSGALGRSYR